MNGKNGNSVEQSIGKLEGTIQTFMELDLKEKERIYQKIKENHEYLKNDVKHALNSHAEIKKDLQDLKNITFNCPVPELEKKINKIVTETETERFLNKNPEIKKGRLLWSIIKIIGYVIGSAILITDLILNFKNI